MEEENSRYETTTNRTNEKKKEKNGTKWKWGDMEREHNNIEENKII